MYYLKFVSQSRNDKGKCHILGSRGEKSTTKVQLKKKKNIYIHATKIALRAIFSQTKRHLGLAPYTFQAFSSSAITTLLRRLTMSQMWEEVFAPQVFQVKKYVINEEELQVIKVECMLCMPLQFNIGNLEVKCLWH